MSAPQRPQAPAVGADGRALELLVREAVAASGGALTPLAAHSPGSRRRRLWELEDHLHCPVIGVCMPIAALRQLVAKVLGGRPVAGDYELHCGVITDCRVRTPMAEAVQRELERRYLRSVRESARAKSDPALSAWWDAALQRGDVAGGLWATLTHPHCGTLLQQRVLGEVHMLQHQAGTASRVDRDLFDAAKAESAALARDLAAAEQLGSRRLAAHARHAEVQQAEIAQLRLRLVGAESLIERLREQIRTLEVAHPDLKSRLELAQESRGQAERLRALERELLRARQEVERRDRAIDELEAQLQVRAATAPEATDRADADPLRPDRLAAHSVLCVGGRAAAVPMYRRIVEQTGARFLHHDGGEEEGGSRLESTMASADLVICQAGCISHNAYWRVKDHCKRTGKRCVFVGTPSVAGIKRALVALVSTAAPAEADAPE